MINRSDRSDPSTQKMNGSIRNNILTHRLGLVANILFLIGAANSVAFSALELNRKARIGAARATYALSFSFFFLSGGVELGIDTVLSRSSRHGRYSSKKGVLNIFISVIFIIGSILDLVAFVLWQERDFTVENYVLYASAHVWLLSSVLAIYGHFTEVNFTDAAGILDGIGNALFFVGCVIDCIVRYLDDDSMLAEDGVAKLEFSSSPMWLGNAICFLLADILRMKHLPKNESSSDNENDDLSV